MRARGALDAKKGRDEGMMTKERSLDELWEMHERKNAQFDVMYESDPEWAAEDEAREKAEREAYEKYWGPGSYDAYIKAMGEMAEAQEAVDEGRAMDLLRCYLCEPDTNKRLDKDAGPLRGIVKAGPVIEAHRDPTASYVLTCGHVII
jgi:hypothetical protein